ncbi:MAG: hypothetical protein OXU51_15660 [Candidatus Poribacteria bacterium]|nr:hypothetical protein [Candidatus Poribacteria bacterium]
MSSQHDDYVAYHNTVNAQNRSNYEVKYRLIGQIPIAIIAISSLYNAFLKDNWNWGIGVLSLLAIICSLVTYIFLYYLLESSISANEQWLEIASKNQNLPPDKQSKEVPVCEKRYDRLTKYTRRACITSIFLCILLTLTIGVSFMSANDTKPKTTVIPPQTDTNKGLVSRPIEPKSKPIEESGLVSKPIVPEGSNPNTIPPPEQPTAQPAPSSDPKPETPKPESPPTDKSTE